MRLYYAACHRSILSGHINRLGPNIEKECWPKGTNKGKERKADRIGSLRPSIRIHRIKQPPEGEEVVERLGWEKEAHAGEQERGVKEENMQVKMAQESRMTQRLGWWLG